MDEPDPYLRAAYASYRDVEQPTQAGVDSTWAALQRRIEAGETGPSLPVEDPPQDEAFVDAAAVVDVVAETPRWPRVLAAAIAVAAGIGVLAWLPPATLLSPMGTGREYVEEEYGAKGANDTGAARFQGDAPSQPRQRAGGRPQRPASESPRPPAPLEPSVVPATEAVPQLGPAALPGALPASPGATVAPRPKRKRSASRPPAQSPPQPLPAVEAAAVAEQATALQDARGVLRQDPAAALEQIQAHRARYPDSPFAREREALALLASCALGRTSAVQPRIDTFVAKHPGSPLTKRVREACEDPQ